MKQFHFINRILAAVVRQQTGRGCRFMAAAMGSGANCSCLTKSFGFFCALAALFFALPTAVSAQNVTLSNVNVATTSVYVEWTCGSADYFDVNVYDMYGMNVSNVTVYERRALISGLDTNTQYLLTVVGWLNGVDGNTDSTVFRTQRLGCAEHAGGGGTYTVGTPSTSTCNVMPVTQGAPYSYVMHWIPASRLTVPSGVMLTGIDFQYAYSQPMTHATNCSIYLGYTSATDNTNGFENFDSLTMVYEGPLNGTAIGWNHFDFNRGSLYYDGTRNIVIAIVNNSGSYDGTDYIWNYTTASHVTRRVSGTSPYTPRTIRYLNPMGDIDSQWQSNMRFSTGQCLRMAECAPPQVVDTLVTTNSAEVIWAPGFQESSWDVDYKAAGSSQWTSLQQMTVNTSETLYNLQPATTYEVRVTANCTDTTMDRTISFTTPCVATPVPLLENFDNWTAGTSAPLGNCWNRLSTYHSGSSIYPYVSTSQHHSGSNAVYLYSDASTYSTLILPYVSPSADSLTVAFWMYKSSSTYNCEVGVMTDPADNNTFTTVATVTPTQASAWEYMEVALTSYQGNGHYVALRSPGGIISYPYIDDVELYYTPSCPRPTSISVTATTNNSVTLQWGSVSGVTDYVVSACAHGAQPSSGALWSFSTNSGTVSGLTTGTIYDFYVLAVCNSGDSSNWWGPASGAPGSYSMRVNQTDTLQMCGGIIYDDGGPNGSYTDNQSSMLILMPQGSGMVSISGTYTGEGCCDHLYIYDGVGDNTTMLCDIMSTSGGTQMTVGPYTASNPAGALTVKFTSDGSVVYDGYALNVSCVSLCNRVTALTASNITQTSATLTWTPGGSETQWVVSDGTATSVVTSPTYTFSGLTAATTYTMAVRAICGAGDTSAPSATTFNTQCGTITLGAQGYNQDFEASTNLPPCWTQDGVNDIWEVADFAYYYSGTGESTAHSGDNVVIIESQDEVARLTTGLFDISGLTSARLKFWHLQEEYFGDQDTLTVMARAGTSASWTQLARYTSNIQHWQCDSLSLAGYTTVQISFLANCGYGTGIAIDDVSITGVATQQPCDIPTSLTTTSLSTATAAVSWSGSGNFEVACKPASSSSWGNATQVSTTSHTFTGLTAATQYDWRVRKVCSSTSQSNWATGTFTTQQAGPDPCDTPTGLSTTQTTATGADVTWTGSGNFEVACKPASSSSWGNSIQVTTTNYSFSGLTAATQYDWRVRKVCSSSNQSSWATGTFTTQQGGSNPDPCDVPTDFSVNNIAATSASLDWTAPSGQHQWQVMVTGGRTVDTTVQGHPVLISGLAPQTHYNAMVRAICDDGQRSDWSGQTPFTTEAETGAINVVTAYGITVTIYPNPAPQGSNVHISIAGADGQVSLRLIDVTGRLLQSSTHNCQTGSISHFNLTGVARGTYFVRIATPGATTLQKLVVR